MAKIHVLNGADVGKSFDVAAGATLGRDASCDIPLRDPSVSRKHARLELEGGRWRVVDTESRNGLHARGERVGELALDDLTEFRLGDVELRFRTEASAGATAPKSAAPVAAGNDVDEIVLEGDWSEPPAPALAPPPKPAATPRPVASPSVARTAPEPVSNAPRGPVGGSFAAPAPRAATSSSAAAPLAATAARARPAQGVVAAGRGVLQFNKVENRAGLFNADLAQMPAWIKLAIGVLALVVFAALFWISFAASFLKGKTQATPDAVEVEGDEAR